MILLALACTTPALEAPPPDFDSAAHEAFRRFFDEDPAPLAIDILAMEAEIDASLDLTSLDVSARSFTPSPLRNVAFVEISKLSRFPLIA